LPKGERCPCREEDDTADERRKQMGVCPYPLRHDITEPPKFMQHLPVDKRGYPIPFFVDYIDGEPEFRAMDQRKFREAVTHRLCWVCGTKLFSEEVFTIGPMCAVNRINSEPPSHRECAEYSAKNCPFLSKPQMIRRTDGLEEKKPAAGIMIERNPGVTLLWYCRRYQIIQSPNRPEAGAARGILFKIGRAFKVEWYCRGRPATRAEVLESLEGGILILREAIEKHDGPEAAPNLERQIAEAMRLLPQ
jgi:hypothetical protein